MGAVAVFDANVLIAFLNRDDASHLEAVARIRAATVPGTRRLLCAVTYPEIAMGPLRRGEPPEDLESMLTELWFETITVDLALARRTAAVRVRFPRLAWPDAFVLATVVHAETRGADDVRLESFDRQLLRAHATLHPAAPTEQSP